MFNLLTWKCHICGAERTEAQIAVLVKPLIVRGNKIGTQNVRYCNDNPACAKGAKSYSFVKDDIGHGFTFE